MKSTQNIEAHNSEIRAIFSRIADKYDFMNQVISFGKANSWRAAAVQELNINNGENVIDLATGSGDLALGIKARFPESLVVGVDLTPGMLRIAKARDIKNNIHWVIADALYLPFKDECFHKIISAYLLRNVADLAACLDEQYRLTKPQGKVAALDTTPPGKSWLSPLVNVYLKYLLPTLGGLLANDYQAYKYLSSSTQNFVRPREIVNKLLEAKFTNIRVKLKMLSTIVILSADKP